MVLQLISTLINSILGPRLFRIYHRNVNLHPDARLSTLYTPPFIEYISDMSLRYLVPSTLIFCIYQRKLNYVVYLIILYTSSYVLRGVGRTLSQPYQSFLRILLKSHENWSTENQELLRRYDFEFNKWPISFKSCAVANFTMESTGNGILDKVMWGVGYVVAHTFGIRLIYPGLMVQGLLRTMLEEGREKYIVQNSGFRSRIQASDGNTIDTMFFDRRSEISSRGKTLVICFEGNAGFYEIGMMVTPLEAGYSILGWNHPGFGGSTGTPYPAPELNAAEAVLSYAVDVLNFKEEEIVLYAWSIGGFSASYIAKAHPKIKGVVLDATFDDILPLAVPRMPRFLEGVVHSTIRSHVNLYTSSLITQYPGPLLLIRRTEDEIIADPPGVLTANRGNYLLIDVLRSRFPALFHEESERELGIWLSRPHIKDPATFYILNSLVTLPPPSELSQLSNHAKSELLLRIASLTLLDFKSSHCIALPPTMFQVPENITPSQSQQRQD